MNIPWEHSVNTKDSEKLYSENIQLRKDLEKEEFLHKTLYKQWNELNVRMLAKERELKRFKSRNLFYKYAFYLILFSVGPVYYFLSTGKQDKRIISPSQTVSSVPPTSKQTVPKDRNTVQIPKVKLEEKQLIQADTAKPKQATINKPVFAKPLTDSVRNLIYSEGWDAYYEKSVSHYRRSSEKYQIWLQGWKDAEKDDKKALTRNSFDTIK